ncbi:MAG: flagellar type III secretion system pore protein FliP [Gemmatimonadaceae bacterium]
MTFSALVGVAMTLALVLSLVAITMRLLRRVTASASTARGGVPMTVVQRIALGPRQGIAVVRIGEQLLAVSVGEGGVRTLAELDAVPEAATTTDPSLARPAFDFKAAVRAGLKNAGLPMAALLLTTLAFAPTARAQATDSTRRATPPRTSAPAPAATSASGRTPTTTTGSTTRSATPAKPGATAAAQVAQPAASLDAVTRALPTLDLKVGENGDGGLRLSGTVGVVVMMGALTMLPALLLLMTSFTRILVVLHFLKQALGTQTTPPAQLLAAMSLLLTGFVMSPTLAEMNRTALTPWMNGTIDQSAMMSAAIVPLRGFMIRQTREQDIAAFIDMSGGPAPARVEDTPTIVLMSAFVTSELRTAFQLGFVLFLPFIIIDIVVSSVLMSMGMFMLPPAMIALPFKLLLFVLVDGWSLLMQSLVAGFR